MILYNRGMELNFKNAVILSMIIHAAIMLSLYRAPAFKMERIKRDQMVVDYIPTEEPKKTEVVKQETKSVPMDTPKVDLLPKVDMKPIVRASPEVSAPRQKEISDELAKKQTQIKSTKDYINYYQLIREKVRRNLKERYRNAYGEGDIGLVFVLRSDGVLVSAEIGRASLVGDQTLRDIALSSLKDAAPFRPFPKAISFPTMSFTVTVTFKKR